MDQEIKIPTNKIRSVSFLSLSMILHASLALTTLYMNSDILQQIPEEKPEFLQIANSNKQEVIEISTPVATAISEQDMQTSTATTNSAASPEEIKQITQSLEPKIKLSDSDQTEVAEVKIAEKTENKTVSKKALPIAKIKSEKSKANTTVVAEKPAETQETANTEEATTASPSETINTAAAAESVDVTNDDSDIEKAQKDLDEEQSKLEAEQNEKLAKIEKEHIEEQQKFLQEEKLKIEKQEKVALAAAKAQEIQEAEQQRNKEAADLAAKEQAERKEKIKLAALAKYEAQEQQKSALAAQKAEEDRKAALIAAQQAAELTAAKRAAEENIRNNSTNNSLFAQAGQQTGSEIRSLSELKQIPGNKKPSYDKEDRLQKRTGEIVFLAFISKEGTPTQFKLVKSTGHRSLDVKTLKTVKQWKFYPGQEGWVEIPYNWNLKGEAEEMPSTLRRKVSQN